MGEPSLRIGVGAYEHTQALLDGRVTVDGADASFQTAPLVSDIFRGLVAGDFDVAEFGLTYFLRTFDRGDRPFLALPIPTARNFRHSAIFVNTASGINKPGDLTGKTIGEFALYGHDSGVWPKGILSDEYGVRPEQCRWVIGGTNHPFPDLDWIPQPAPAGVDIRRAPDGQTLGAMLETGEIDALMSVDVPRALLDASSGTPDGSPGTPGGPLGGISGEPPTIARLFPDYVTAERDYYRRTGIFPPMHVVAIRADLAERADLVRAVYRAFCEAKEIAQQRYREGALKQHMNVLTPWFSALFEDNRRLLGDDWWPYGVSANRAAFDTFLRYHHGQGLSRTRLTCDDIVVPALAGT